VLIVAALFIVDRCEFLLSPFSLASLSIGFGAGLLSVVSSFEVVMLVLHYFGQIPGSGGGFCIFPLSVLLIIFEASIFPKLLFGESEAPRYGAWGELSFVRRGSGPWSLVDSSRFGVRV